jgi:tetratricopeptide (TPR) repeat protein
MIKTRPALGFVVIFIVFAAPLVSQTQIRAPNPTQVAELLRRADAAFVDENRALAEKLYRQVLDLDPYQSRALFRMGQLSRDDEIALGWFLLYHEQEPDDAWGWLAAGDKYLKVGKTVEAQRSYARAAKIAPKAKDVLERLARGRLRAAPTIEPLGGYAGDSDLDRTWRSGLKGDLALPGGLRLGLMAAHSRIGDGTADATLDEGVLRLEGRPRQSLRLDLSIGAARLRSFEAEGWTTAQAEFRFRWRGPRGGPSLEVRAQRLPLGTTPLLVANRAMKNEARLGMDLPAGPLTIRFGGRAASIETFVETSNQRLQGDAALVYPLGTGGEISIQYHRLGFERPSEAGYFAPRFVETIESGTYWDFGGEGRVSASLDLGIGLQRLARSAEPTGPWKIALRGWGAINVDLSPIIQLRAEAEAYSAPFAPAGVAVSADWRYMATSLGLLVRLK